MVPLFEYGTDKNHCPGSESIIKDFRHIESDFFHTRTALLIAGAPKELRKRLPKVTRHEEEYHFLGGSSQASFVTTNQEGKEVIVIPSYRLETGILTGAIPCENVKDGNFTIGNMEQNFIPQEEIFPIIARTFPLPQGQLDYLTEMYAKKTSY